MATCRKTHVLEQSLNIITRHPHCSYKLNHEELMQVLKAVFHIIKNPVDSKIWMSFALCPSCLCFLLSFRHHTTIKYHWKFKFHDWIVSEKYICILQVWEAQKYPYIKCTHSTPIMQPKNIACFSCLSWETQLYTVCTSLMGKINK